MNPIITSNYLSNKVICTIKIYKIYTCTVLPTMILLCIELLSVATYFKCIINNYNSLFNNFDVCVKNFTSLLMSCTCTYACSK